MVLSAAQLLQRRLPRRRQRRRRRLQVPWTCVAAITVRRLSAVWSGRVVAFVVFRDDVPAGRRRVVGAHLTVDARLDSCRAGTGDVVGVRPPLRAAAAPPAWTGRRQHRRLAL